MCYCACLIIYAVQRASNDCDLHSLSIETKRLFNVGRSLSAVMGSCRRGGGADSHRGGRPLVGRYNALDGQYGNSHNSCYSACVPEDQTLTTVHSLSVGEQQLEDSRERPMMMSSNYATGRRVEIRPDVRERPRLAELVPQAY